MKWAWVVFVLVTTFHAVWFFVGSRGVSRENPLLAATRKEIFRGLLFWGNLPWAVMGIGILWGSATSIRDFFRSREGNPFVLAFLASVVLVWVVGTRWIFFRGGAQKLADHCDALSTGSSAPVVSGLRRPTVVKVLWLVCLAGGVSGMLAMLFGDHGMSR